MLCCAKEVETDSILLANLLQVRKIFQNFCSRALITAGELLSKVGLETHKPSHHFMIPQNLWFSRNVWLQGDMSIHWSAHCLLMHAALSAMSIWHPLNNCFGSRIEHAFHSSGLRGKDGHGPRKVECTEPYLTCVYRHVSPVEQPLISVSQEWKNYLSAILWGHQP